MGKRELLLIAAFLIVGVVVYQATVPPPAPGERSFSLSQLVSNIRREIRGNNSFAEVTTTTSHTAPQAPGELRLKLGRADVTITGGDRANIEAELHVRSSGFDTPEAERLARETVLKFDDTASILTASLSYPEGGRQTATLALKVPARLSVRMDPGSGTLKITNVAAVDVLGARGETEIGQVAGRVSATQTGGEFRAADIGSLKVTTRGSDVRLDRVRGEAVINVRNGELKGSALAGNVELDSNGTDVTIEKLEALTGTLRVNAVNGTLTLRGLRADGRIDARGAEVAVEIDRAAPLAIYSDGDDRVTVTAPSAGYQLDAIAQHGRITVPEGTVQVAVNGQEQRATGPVRGGGGTITIRSTSGDIVVKDRGVDETRPRR